MMKNRCEVCGRATKRKSLCEAHYYRLRRTGSLGTEEVWDKVKPVCSEPDCDKEHRARGLCDLHYQRFRNTGTTALLPAPSGESHPMWVGGAVGYMGAHNRVRRARGKATEHACRCGKQAAQWAAIPDRCELEEAGMPYSADPSNYKAMCVSCHKAMDLNRLAVGRG